MIPRWKVVKVRKLTKREKSKIIKAEIVETTYGFSVCFTMKSGSKEYIPVSSKIFVNADNVGDIIPLDTIKVLTLKGGTTEEDEIERIEY